MFNRFILLAGVFLAGCATVPDGEYRPAGGQERAAFAKADLAISPAAVRAGFAALQGRDVAWAGIIKDIQYKETERTIQVAFMVEHRHFDWKERGGKKPFQLSAGGDGAFVAGWTVAKPTSIGYLKTLAAPGDLLIVYGAPYRIAADGAIQLTATAVRPIAAEKVALGEPAE